MDTGNFVDKVNLDPYIKYSILRNHWIPPPNYEYPWSEHIRAGGTKKRKPSKKHLDNYTWLVLSDVCKGLFCKYCFLFAPTNVSNVELKTLVKKPLLNFSKLTGKNGYLEVHNRNKYHRDALQSGQQFLLAYENPNNSVINQVNSFRFKQVTENRERLKPIIETLILCGKQNIPLRGHRDDGELLNSNQQLLKNDGNFREILRYRVQSGDMILKKHLESSSSRATYISKETQNKLLHCIGDELKSLIVDRIKDVGIYAIIFDETTDMSHTEQLSLSLRYVCDEKIYERFIQFVDAYKCINDNDIVSGELKLTGRAIGHIVLDILEKLGLDSKLCVGVGTDGCSVMTSNDIGAVTTILETCPMAVRCPCFNHALNISLSQSSKVVSIRNTVSILKEIIAFFNSSAKRQVVLKNILKHNLKGLCQTHWIEMHGDVFQFKSSLSKVNINNIKLYI